MPADRPHRRANQTPVLPVPLDQRCQVIPAPGQPGCLRKGFGKPRRLCGEHRAQYKALYATYKGLSWQVGRLDDEIAAEQDWALVSEWNKARVSLAVSLRTRHVNAINAEIAAREQHRNLFIGDSDEGHVGWLDRLRAKRQRSTDILVRLRRRAEELANTPEHRAIVEMQPEHVPEPVWQAQRRATEAKLAEQARARRAQVFQRISQEQQRRAALDETHRRDEARRQQAAYPAGVYLDVSNSSAGQSRAAPTSLPSARVESHETEPLLVRSIYAPLGTYAYRAPPTGFPARSTTAPAGLYSYRAPPPDLSTRSTNAPSGSYSYRAPPAYRHQYDVEAQRTWRSPSRWHCTLLPPLAILALLALSLLFCISYALLSSRR